MRILTRYMVARFLGFFVAFLIVSTATIVIVEMMLNLGDMLDGDRGLPGVVEYLVLRVHSYYLPDLVPIVAFAAAFVTMGFSARWLEISAMKAGGVAPHRVAVPVLLCGILLTGVSFAFNETVVRGATQRWNLRNAGDVTTGGVPVSFRQGSFWYHRGRTIYNIREADRESQTLRGVRVFELDPNGRLRRSIEAPTAVVDADHRWHFDSPVIRTFGTSATDAPATSRREGPVSLALADETDLALMSADVATLSLLDLRSAIAQRAREGREPGRLQAVLHARLAAPFALLIFVLAAIPLGVRVERAQGQGMTLAALQGIAIIAAFHALQSIGSRLAGEGIVPPSTAPWILLGLFGAYGLLSYWRMPG